MKTLKINEEDNVAVVIDPGESGITAGHKVALTDIKAGEKIIKYGNCIGTATEDIKKGDWVHTHNVKTALEGQKDYSYEPVAAPTFPKRELFFNGYKRKNGRAGIRNDVYIIPTVGCVGKIAENIAKKASRFVTSDEIEVIALSHPYGCSQLGDDQDNTRQILADLILHPNVGGVLVLSLGCENSNLSTIKPLLKGMDEDRVKFLVCQESEDEVADGVEIVKGLIKLAESEKRVKVPADELVVGLKCGGSDGFSGITANPTVGRFSDLLTAAGGTTILTEVPEMFGAEHLLMNRCETKELFDKTVSLINDFKDYFISHGQVVYENPSPGNKAGGITTLEDKSLGCTQKSGKSAVKGVLKYGERVETKGLNLLSAPGNDLVAATALAASGAQLVLFTTGRGTPFASPVPTLKISSNSALAAHKKNWIDFNAGVVLEGMTLEETGDLLLSLVLEVASGKRVKSELAGLYDMAVFKNGVTL
ncbi:MAG: altronate dehydratase [Lachnospiraceae bacterium]|nr:altronate dehydratase [Lachnospiraceae bacterium]MBP5184110.1 altronate dehydratase [Lachnospiraceae bacterium]